MKITTKKPRQPRGRSDEKRQATKEVIREAYINGPRKEVKIIPAKTDQIPEGEKRKLRVCAYYRVSTDEDAQAGSFELQVQEYTKRIQENPQWEFAGVFADEGVSGTSVHRRDQFLEMIEKCQAGEIDLIITKHVSRFSRNMRDSLNYIDMLRRLDPPVGVYFETHNANTLDSSSDLLIAIMSYFAQEESVQKSESIKWAFRHRREQGLGIYPNWALLGYRGQNWEIVEEEAEIVRLIYSLYLDGYSSGQIAELLTENGVPTVKGLPVWQPGSVLNILRNEKYCGDALCQKTVTVDFFSHKSVKNDGRAKQYFIEGNHSPIINKEDWLMAQKIREERRYKGRARKPKPQVVVKGPLAGFVIVDPRWSKSDVDTVFRRLAEKNSPSPTSAVQRDENSKTEKE